MACKRFPHSLAMACLAVLLSAIRCLAQDPPQGAPQDPPQDHSCTANAAFSYVTPYGRNGNDFDKGLGFQAGVGFAVTDPVERRGLRLYIAPNFMYQRLKATSQALAAAIAGSIPPGGTTPQLANATSAHGSFTAVTLDPTLRYQFNPRASVYLSGGFGWFRQEVGFTESNAVPLTQPANSAVDRVSSNSGVFDAALGGNLGLTRRGGLMLYLEIRVYRGEAVNSGMTLVPVSFGVRW